MCLWCTKAEYFSEVERNDNFILYFDINVAPFNVFVLYVKLKQKFK